MSLTFALIIPSWDSEQAEKTARQLTNIDSRGNTSICQLIISGANRTEKRWGTVKSMAEGAKKVNENIDVLVFCHDDIEIYKPWAEYLELIFTARPAVGLIGLHGALGLGSEGIYRTQYELSQLARYQPVSNIVDAEAHGVRTSIPREVATVDGFFMAVRKTAYKSVGGWEACLKDNIPYHMYDHWMAMALREQGWKTYLAPVSCKHYGGGTEVKKSKQYEEWAKQQGFKDASNVHTQGHIAFYNRFRGQLPIRIT